jgi:hypothetical protein
MPRVITVCVPSSPWWKLSDTTRLPDWIARVVAVQASHRGNAGSLIFAAIVVRLLASCPAKDLNHSGDEIV